MLVRMARPQASTRTTFERIHGGRWSATIDTPRGPVTAIGESIGEAQAELDELLAITRALEVTHRHHRDSHDSR